MSTTILLKNFTDCYHPLFIYLQLINRRGTEKRVCSTLNRSLSRNPFTRCDTFLSLRILQWVTSDIQSSCKIRRVLLFFYPQGRLVYPHFSFFFFPPVPGWRHSLRFTCVDWSFTCSTFGSVFPLLSSKSLSVPLLGPKD